MQAQVKDFEHPDEKRLFEGKGWTDVVTVADRPVMASHYEPGWKWSVNVKPIAGTELCQVNHVAYCLSGRLRIHMEDGTTFDLKPGTVAAIPPGHDAEVIGDEPAAVLDFGDVDTYAKRG
jgi:ethanolamine utilization protein EutQ (cupin superfamily)